jgi:hypothetical protein
MPDKCAPLAQFLQAGTAASGLDFNEDKSKESRAASRGPVTYGAASNTWLCFNMGFHAARFEARLSGNERARRV